MKFLFLTNQPFPPLRKVEPNPLNTSKVSGDVVSIFLMFN